MRRRLRTASKWGGTADTARPRRQRVVARGALKAYPRPPFGASTERTR
jgi:hypothetical protein